MKSPSKSIALAALVMVPSLAAIGASYRRCAIVPPAPAREFRGVWIATVANIDWPSRPGLSTAEQKRELLAILDRAAQLKLNTVILQVRPECDAFYASAIEPWSEFLTGRMGRAPEPFYDPLAFAVAEAHKRGLELQAWFNPFRALHFSSKSPIAPNHVSRVHPDWIRKYDRCLWLDPGEPAARDYTLGVVMDVVRRYDIDGVQFDDYFYPGGANADGDSGFPDEATWSTYGAHGGLSRTAWRRRNINTFIERVYRSIKAVKPWVKFGVSPFGIWRPGFPPQIRGSDTYANQAADSRKWLASGWVDYLAPQLYWPIEPPQQSFSALLDWWSAQNVKGRGLWPGIAGYRAGDWKPDEIANQIRLTRRVPRTGGYAIYSATSLMRNAALDRTLATLNTGPALVPAMPWLEAAFPGQPAVSVTGLRNGGARVRGQPAPASRPEWWLVQTRTGADWKTEIVPGTGLEKYFSAPAPAVIAVNEIDRYGQASKAAVFEIVPQNSTVARRPRSGRR